MSCGFGRVEVVGGLRNGVKAWGAGGGGIGCEVWGQLLLALLGSLNPKP